MSALQTCSVELDNRQTNPLVTVSAPATASIRACGKNTATGARVCGQDHSIRRTAARASSSIFPLYRPRHVWHPMRLVLAAYSVANPFSSVSTSRWRNWSTFCQVTRNRDNRQRIVSAYRRQAISPSAFTGPLTTTSQCATVKAAPLRLPASLRERPASGGLDQRVRRIRLRATRARDKSDTQRERSAE